MIILVFIEYLLLAGMVFSGILSIHTDLRYGIVKNRISLCFFIYALIVNILYYVCFASNFFINWIANLGILTLAAILLYGGKIWGAGDAKLFILMFLFVPGRLLDGFSLSYGILPYIYVFLVAVGWLIIDTVKHFKKYPMQREPFSFSLTELISIGKTIIETSAFGLVISILLPNLPEQHSLFFSFLIIFYSYYISSKTWSQKFFVVLSHLIVIIFFVTRNHISFSSTSFVFIPAVIIVTFLVRFSSLYNYKEIPTSSVESGMILSSATTLLFQTSSVRHLPTNYSEDMSARLTEEEANAVRRWEHSVKGKPSVIIVRKIPFAVFIPLGFLLFIIIRIVR